ncbi:helix-turn-helix transcriptional regulator [Clostridiaceae bacterium M8S5]|nr:helix-turn-helix transcriptional regulator [Clostridiaceae bacterium M8S5]
MKNYNNIIRDLREDQDLSQSFIASILGTSQQIYSRYELGIRELPIKHLITLCKFYNVSADYILCLKKSKDKK